MKNILYIILIVIGLVALGALDLLKIFGIEV